LEYILVLLIVALLNGAIAYIDGLMEGIVPLTLYAEQYMSTLAGVDLFEALFDIVFGFGVSLIILKFLKKGFETYVLWSDGDADEEPIALLTNFFKAMAVAVCFPTMYGWLAGIGGRGFLERKPRGHALFLVGSKRLHVNFEIPAYKFAYMGKAGGR